jgi:hypothetical protein
MRSVNCEGIVLNKPRNTPGLPPDKEAAFHNRGSARHYCGDRLARARG